MNLKRLLSRGAVSLGVVALGIGALGTAANASPSGQVVSGTVTCGSGGCPGPNDALGYTGTLKVTGSGFGTELNTVHVLECVHGATDASQCDANTDDPSFDANISGNFSDPSYTYYSLPNDALGLSSIHCDATHLCDLLLIQDDYNNFSNPHVLIPLTFDTGVQTPETPWLPLLPLGGVALAGAGYLIWRKRQNETSNALAA
jgi:hypothetical protein